MKNLALATTLALAGLALAGDLTEQNWREQRAKIAPAKDELAYEELGWRASFLAGLKEAQEKDRPILLWVMNGHPLGCT